MRRAIVLLAVASLALFGCDEFWRYTVVPAYTDALAFEEVNAATITVDGDSADWAGIEPLSFSFAGDTITNIVLLDLFIAYDETYLYYGFAFDTDATSEFIATEDDIRFFSLAVAEDPVISLEQEPEGGLMQIAYVFDNQLLNQWLLVDSTSSIESTNWDISDIDIAGTSFVELRYPRFWHEDVFEDRVFYPLVIYIGTNTDTNPDAISLATLAVSEWVYFP